MHTSTKPQIKYTLLRRKPSKWAVEFEGRTGTVEKTGDTGRSGRWKLTEDTSEDSRSIRHFRSRREAFHFFRTGERFETNPVFAVLGGRRGTKRIR